MLNFGGVSHIPNDKKILCGKKKPPTKPSPTMPRADADACQPGTVGTLGTTHCCTSGPVGPVGSQNFDVRNIKQPPLKTHRGEFQF